MPISIDECTNEHPFVSIDKRRKDIKVIDESFSNSKI